jgi:glycosyltransferase involved in cell wall biosynthesis
MSEPVVFVLPDKMGGASNIVANLLAHRAPDAFTYHTVLTCNRLSHDTRFGGAFAADSQRTVEYRLPVENLHAVMRRLRDALPPGGGVLVASDLLELATAAAFDLERTVMLVLHGDHDYYYDLAARHDAVIDVFVCYGRTMFETLRARLPHRTDSIVHLPYGIPLPPTTRRAGAGPLRLLFAGRLEHGQKGVLDLPIVDRALGERNVPVTWTIVGGGPDEEALRRAWPDASHVRWAGVRPNADVMAIASEHDVFVLPTRAEGFPVALVEAMAVGLVPVVSDLASGVREALDDGVEGLTAPIGDAGAFADAIASLHADRGRLERMSLAARRRVSSHHDIRDRVVDYQRLFARHRELRRPRAEGVTVPYGSRLDRPWIPNAAVKAVRTVVRRASGKPV